MCARALHFCSSASRCWTFSHSVGHDAKQQKRKLLEDIKEKLSAITKDLATVKEANSSVAKDVARVKEVQQLLAEEKPAKRFSPSPSGVPIRQPENLRMHCFAH